jgi:hypothetical protein
MQTRLLSLTTLIAAALFGGVLHPAAAAEGPAVDFNRDIRPILSNTCYACHGPDEKERKAGLRLDVKEGAFTALETGAVAVVPGKLETSELYQRLISTDPNEVMPPPKSGKTLTPQQIELFRRWIEQGAPWKGHWSFTAPVRPELPPVKHTAAVRNPVDRFVLARLEREGLSLAPEADKVTLLRRLTFDLTGLPPTLAEIDAFLADNSPTAYQTVVDRLLNSSRYGEHMARFWLDSARYGDTHGLHLDNERSHWPYREWVIGAFNDNIPFDRFTVEQLAGDLLPDATIDQKIASGFNRCNVTTSEGGSINEEVLVRYTVDRVETTGTVFMGLSLGCAVCHDHKYDPITQKEFYQLYAFFNSIAENAMDGNAIGPPPTMKLPTPEQTAELKSLDEQTAQARQKIAEELARIEYVEPPAAAETVSAEPKEYVWIDDALPPGANAQGNSPWEFVSKADKPVYSGEKSSTRTADGLSQHFFTDAKPGLKIGEGDRLFAYVYLDPANPPQEIMLQWNDGNWEHRATWGDDVIPWGNANSPSRLPIGPLPTAGEWVRLEVEAAKVGLKPGAVLNGWAFTQHGGTVYWDKAGSVTRTPQDGQSFESQLAWEAYEKAQSNSSLPGPVIEAIKVETDKRTDDHRKTIRNYFLENIYAKTRPIFEPLQKQVADLTAKRNAVDAAIPITLVSAEMPERREAFLLVRGQYDKKGDKVTPGVPAVFPPLPGDAPLDRLGFARWLADSSHPLTARVAVNRFWQQLFGTGLVKTAEDFGSQGQWPSHPELLDWLAVEFVSPTQAPSVISDPKSEIANPPSENPGTRPVPWDVKRLLKLIVMSATYRQSSRVSPELAARDPENELLARGPRFRMDAEVVRDTALAISGLLVERIGGKSVKPYQPEGVWEAVGFVGSNTRDFKQDHGAALYRRSMYTFWKRTSPPPSLAAFDAPSRENCTVRRARTNTPLQALTLMNDVQYVEASRQFAQRILQADAPSIDDRIAFAFRTATARPPTSTETTVLKRIYEAQLAEFQADKEAAGKLLSVGESKRDESLDAAAHAAWTMVANVILNLDETVTKE